MGGDAAADGGSTVFACIKHHTSRLAGTDKFIVGLLIVTQSHHSSHRVFKAERVSISNAVDKIIAKFKCIEGVKRRKSCAGNSRRDAGYGSSREAEPLRREGRYAFIGDLPRGPLPRKRRHA